MSEHGTIEKTDISFGPASRNRSDETTDPSARGAEAALETFYYALNNQDREALRADWSAHQLAQLNNPVGGILRGGGAIGALYEKVFAGHPNVRVVFGDVVAYPGADHAVFAGRESGSWTDAEGNAVPLEIRTSRYFRYDDGRWQQFHHHGSIDDPAAPAAYQHPVRG